MSYRQEDVERVRRILSDRQVVEKKMMGGLVFMVDGHMCCGLSRGALMVRVGPDTREKALTLPHARPFGFGGRSPLGFVYVDAEGWRSAQALAVWLQRGLDFVATLPAKKSAKSGPRSKSPRKKEVR